MSKPYQIYQELQQHKARLQASVTLENGTGLASWCNQYDRVSLLGGDHHTLSLYIADGYESYMKTPVGWRNGGGPDRLCLLPEGFQSEWDIRGPLSFVHFYFSDHHLRDIAESTWDKSPVQLSVDEHIFAEDPVVTTIYRQFLLRCRWNDGADRMMLSSAVSLLLTHLLKKYTEIRPLVTPVTGGLAPFLLMRVREYIDAHLAAPLQLADLAAVVCLSEYHFARMFKQSTGMAPHQYVMRERLLKARHLLESSSLPLTEIALLCGFSSSSHFSNRFRQMCGITPSHYRQK